MHYGERVKCEPIRGSGVPDPRTGSQSPSEVQNFQVLDAPQSGKIVSFSVFANCCVGNLTTTRSRHILRSPVSFIIGKARSKKTPEH